MVGIATRLKKGELKDLSKIKERYQKLLENSEYLQAVSQSTSDEKNVKNRVAEAINAFADI
jgi:hypothetical protein